MAQGAAAQDQTDRPKLTYGLIYRGDSFDGSDEASAFLEYTFPFQTAAGQSEFRTRLADIWDFRATGTDERHASFAESELVIAVTPDLHFDIAGSAARAETVDGRRKYGGAVDLLAGLKLGSFSSTEVEGTLRYRRSSEDYTRVEDIVDGSFLDERYAFPGTEKVTLGAIFHGTAYETKLEFGHEDGFAGSRANQQRNSVELTVTWTDTRSPDSDLYVYSSAKAELVDIPDGSPADRAYTLNAGAGGQLGGYYFSVDGEASYYQAVGPGALTGDFRSYSLQTDLTRETGDWTSYWYASYDRNEDVGSNSVEDEYYLLATLTIPTDTGPDFVLGGEVDRYEGSFVGGDITLTESSIFVGVEFGPTGTGSRNTDVRVRLTLGYDWNSERSTFAGGINRDEAGASVGLQLRIVPSR